MSEDWHCTTCGHQQYDHINGTDLCLGPADDPLGCLCNQYR